YLCVFCEAGLLMRGLCCLKFCILPSIVIVLAAAGISLFLSPMRAAAITQDRARRTHRGVQSQPAPASTSTLGPSTRSTPLPSPTPTQVPSPRDRIAPQLGEPPPPPVLKAKPSPTPEGGEEIDPESVVRVNTELVTLNVRVIDRNNKPIGDVTESDLRVFEDGEPQPIEFFSKERSAQ